MTGNSLWMQVRGTSSSKAGAGSSERSGEHDPIAVLLSGETWLTLLISVVAFLAVLYSIESANWTREMPSLVVAGMLGLATGWLFAHVPLSAFRVNILAIAWGLTLSVIHVMHTMRLEDPLLSSGISVRWREMRDRTAEWLQAALEGGISNDPLPFVLMLVFGMWAMSYLAGWAIFRWRNAWVALIPAGFALLTNISYLPGQPSEEFIVFLFASILLVTRLHYLRAQTAWRRERVPRATYLSFEVFSFATWIGLILIVFAWIVPTANNWGPVADVWIEVLRPVSDRVDRVGRLFIGISSKQDRHLHSFGDTLPIRGKVSLDSDEILMRVVAPEPLYLRAAVYDEYTAQGWQVSDASTRPLPGTSIQAASFGSLETRAQIRRPVAVDIEVERSVSSRRLFTVGEPLAASVEARLVTGENDAEVIGIVPESRIRDGDTYSTVGTISVASLDQLLTSGDDYPAGISERYLALPDDLPMEVRDLAQDIVGGDHPPYSIARRVELFLRREYKFDLETHRPPPRTDSVAYFLFDDRRGYFDHYASAMAVLLRTVGVPTRVVTGFTLNDADFDIESKSYLVTERRAWAWTEVYFQGLGWVEFNPTPGQPLISRSGEELAFIAWIEPFDEGFSLFEIGEMIGQNDPGTVVDLMPGSDIRAGDTVSGVPLAEAFRWLSLASLGIFGIWAGAAGWWAYRFRSLSPMVSRWAKLEQLSRWAGIFQPVHLTPLERAAVLTEFIGRDAEIRPLAGAYTRERYGRFHLAVDDSESGAVAPNDRQDYETERLAQLYLKARGKLVRQIVRRCFRLRRKS